MRRVGNLIFATIARMLCGNHLKNAKLKIKTSNPNFGELKPTLKLSQ